MTNIAEVIAWKFNNQSGMATSDGKITQFPGGIPTQAEQDAWTLEYEARDINAERVDKAFSEQDIHKMIFEGFFEVANRLQAIEGKQPLERSQLKTWFKNKLD